MSQSTVPKPGWAAQMLLGEVPSGESEHALVLRVVQPALAGLMDGSVSTLAPLFAAKSAAHSAIHFSLR